MGEEVKYQLRLTLSDSFAEVARNHPEDPSIAPLTQLLRRHDAALKCQYDAFADYVKEAEAKGVEGYPLYAFTKRTVDDPAKKAKYTKSFTLYVGCDEVYERRGRTQAAGGRSHRGADVQVRYQSGSQSASANA